MKLNTVFSCGIFWGHVKYCYWLMPIITSYVKLWIAIEDCFQTGFSCGILWGSVEHCYGLMPIIMPNGHNWVDLCINVDYYCHMLITINGS